MTLAIADASGGVGLVWRYWRYNFSAVGLSPKCCWEMMARFNSAGAKPLFRWSAVEKLLADNERGSAEKFSLLVLELWHQKFVDGGSDGTSKR